MSFGKRVLDVGLVLATAVAWVPCVAGLAVLVWLYDGRPIFFPQTRVGKERRPFLIWKLRTMTLDPDPARRGPTHLGSFMRKRGLDELPQVWNVLRGDMSLVGPRPLLLEDVSRLEALYPPFAARFAVAPGITGLAQICLAQGAEETTLLDARYVQTRSVGRDLAIIARSAWINLVGKQRGCRRWHHRHT